MRLFVPIRDLLRGEDGSFMGNVIFLAIVIAIVGIIVIDGTAVFYVSQSVGETTQVAANLAADEFKLTQSDIRAENAAADHCEAKELEFMKFKVNWEEGHTFDVTCGRDVETYVFKYLPFLDELLHQQATKTSQAL